MAASGFSAKTGLRLALNDQEIIQGCKEGKPSAQKALYEKYRGRMMAVCNRYIPDKALAEDVFSEAFVKVFNSLHLFNGNNPEGWMRKIFVNHAINYYHRQWKKNLHSDLEYAASAEAHWPDALDTMSNQELLEVIAGLPDGCRMVFNLYVIEGYDHNEIAQMLGVSEGTSKSQLHRAKALLRAKLVSINTKT